MTSRGGGRLPSAGPRHYRLGPRRVPAGLRYPRAGPGPAYRRLAHSDLLETSTALERRSATDDRAPRRLHHLVPASTPPPPTPTSRSSPSRDSCSSATARTTPTDPSSRSPRPSSIRWACRWPRPSSPAIRPTIRCISRPLKRCKSPSGWAAGPTWGIARWPRSPLAPLGPPEATFTCVPSRSRSSAGPSDGNCCGRYWTAPVLCRCGDPASKDNPTNWWRRGSRWTCR